MSFTRNLFINALWEIRSKDKWCQSDYAQNAKGESVFVRDDDACRFCSVGVIEKADGGTFNVSRFVKYVKPIKGGKPFTVEVSDLIGRFDEYLKPDNNDRGLIKFNDNHTYKKVIDMWIRFGIDQGYLPTEFKMKQLKELRNSL